MKFKKQKTIAEFLLVGKC